MVGKDGLPDPATKVGHRVTHSYDGQGRLAALKRGEQPYMRYQYDRAGNLTHTILPDLSQTARSFDTEGRLIAEAEYGPLGSRGSLRTYAYDHAGALQSSDSGVTPSAGDDRQQVRTREIGQQPGGADAGLAFQRGQTGSMAHAWVETVARPDGSAVTRWVDDFGRLSALRSPEKGVVTGEYDAAGNLTMVRDASGVTTRITRDMLGRALQVDYSAAPHGKPASIVFACNGQVLASETRFNDGKLDNQISWESAPWGRPSAKLLHVAARGKAAAVRLSLKTDVEIEGLRVHKTLPGGAEVSYQHDLADNITDIKVNGKPVVSAVKHGVNARGARPVEFIFGNGLRTRTTFDANGLLAAHESGVDKLIFKINAAQQIESIARHAVTAPAAIAQAGFTLPSLISSAHAAPAGASTPAPLLQAYHYDTLGRLTREQQAAARVADLEYDVLGNRKNVPANRTDADGNVVSHAGMTLAYNQAGQLVRVADAAGTTLAEYRYDAAGMRVAKHVAGQSSYFLYDDGQLVAEADGNGQVLTEYIYLGRRPVARLRYAAQQGALASAMPAVFGREPVLEYLHADHRSPVEAVLAKVQSQGRREGWSTAQVIGMTILVALAIAAMIAVAIFAGAIISAIAAAISAAVAAAAAGGVALMAALAAIFALAPATAAAAEKKAEEKKQGLLDSTISWFKSWF